MIRVPVVNPDGTPAMPCKASRARRLVRDGRAIGKRNKLGIYYIQLIDEPSGRETQTIVVGNDPGKHYTGIGLQSSKFTLLSKIYPISSIVYEYVKADIDLTSGRSKARSGKGFSPLMVGQTWAIEQLSKIAPVVKKLGWQTSNLRKHLGLPKQKANKKEAIPSTHAVDGICLAATQLIDYLPFENSQGRGHCWQGKVEITDAPFFVIRRPPISRRQLHLMIPSKGGNRRKYGGTNTRHGFKKGDYVEAEKAQRACPHVITYQGWCSGDTARQVSISNAAWKRIGQFTASKVKLLRRATGLICKQEANFLVAV